MFVHGTRWPPLCVSPYSVVTASSCVSDVLGRVPAVVDRRILPRLWMTAPWLQTTGRTPGACHAQDDLCSLERVKIGRSGSRIRLHNLLLSQRFPEEAFSWLRPLSPLHL